MTYGLGCSRCGEVYGANGSDIHLRKYPSCQGGSPGLPLRQAAPVGLSFLALDQTRRS
jgi:hypothetical protein